MNKSFISAKTTEDHTFPLMIYFSFIAPVLITMVSNFQALNLIKSYMPDN